MKHQGVFALNEKTLGNRFLINLHATQADVNTQAVICTALRSYISVKFNSRMKVGK